MHRALAGTGAGSVFTGVLARLTGETVGNYAITLGTVSAGSNYDTVLAATRVTFAIGRATVTVTPTSGQSKVYGTADPALAYTHSALAGTDTGSVFTGVLRSEERRVGNKYRISLGTVSASSNYDTVLAATPVTFSIGRATGTVT